MPSEWDRTSVIKKISPKQAGARKLAQRYGDALVCVRQRHDAEGLIRYTTVELVVEQAPIARRRPDGELLGVRLENGEFDLRRRVIAAGGQWDPHIRIWWLTRGAARRLSLFKRVVTAE